MPRRVGEKRQREGGWRSDDGEREEGEGVSGEWKMGVEGGVRQEELIMEMMVGNWGWILGVNYACDEKEKKGKAMRSAFESYELISCSLLSPLKQNTHRK